MWLSTCQACLKQWTWFPTSWPIPVIPKFRKLKQEDQRFKVTPGCIRSWGEHGLHEILNSKENAWQMLDERCRLKCSSPTQRHPWHSMTTTSLADTGLQTSSFYVRTQTSTLGCKMSRFQTQCGGNKSYAVHIRTAACHPRSPDYTHYLGTSTLSNQANWWFRTSELAVYKGIVPCQLESSEATFRRTQPLSPPPKCHSKSLEGQCGCKHSFDGIASWTGCSEWRLVPSTYMTAYNL